MLDNHYIFIQIGSEFINQSGRGDIIRAQILEEERYHDGRIMYPKRLKVVLREIEGSEVCGSYSASKRYEFDTPEGQALFKWLTEHSEVLLPYSEPVTQVVNEEVQSPTLEDHPF